MRVGTRYVFNPVIFIQNYDVRPLAHSPRPFSPPRPSPRDSATVGEVDYVVVVSHCFLVFAYRVFLTMASSGSLAVSSQHTLVGSTGLRKRKILFGHASVSPSSWLAAYIEHVYSAI